MRIQSADCGTMLAVVRAYLDPDDLRTRLLAEPSLAQFVTHFTQIEEKIRSAVDRTSQRQKAEQESLKARLSEVDVRLAHLIRETWFLLESARHTEDPEIAAVATRLQGRLLPEGRSIVRGTPLREAAAATHADLKLSPEDRRWMDRLRGPGGSLSELHARRLELTEELMNRAGALNLARIYEKKPMPMVPVRLEFGRIIQCLEAVVGLLPVPASERRLLLSPLVRFLGRAPKMPKPSGRPKSRSKAKTSEIESSPSSPSDDNSGRGGRSGEAENQPVTESTKEAGGSKRRKTPRQRRPSTHPKKVPALLEIRPVDAAGHSEPPRAFQYLRQTRGRRSK